MIVGLLSAVSNIRYETSSLNSNLDFVDLATKILNIIIISCFGFLIALIIREVVCWYWKINDIKNLLEDIKKNTQPDVNKPKLPNEPDNNN